MTSKNSKSHGPPKITSPDLPPEVPPENCPDRPSEAPPEVSSELSQANEAPGLADLLPVTPGTPPNLADEENQPPPAAVRRSLGQVILTTLRDLRGLITFADVLAWVGFWLYRGTLRRTTAVAVTMFFLYVLGQKVNTGMTIQSAVTGTGLILLLSCVGGFALMLISGSFSRYFLYIAEAKGSNLLEEMKKNRGTTHAAAIWHHVIEPEVRAADPAAVEQEQTWLAEHHDECQNYLMGRIRRLEADPPDWLTEPMSRLGLTYQGWGFLFDFAVNVPMSRTEMHDRLRYDLTMVKDWYDGAPFHHTDCKLEEHFFGHEALLRARRLAGMGAGHTIRWSFKRMRQSMWFRSIARATQLRVASACCTLDRRYPGYTFYPDHFFWPSAEVDRQVREHAGPEALADLRGMRAKLFHRVFSSRSELAVQLMQRAVHPDFEAATLLRRRVDAAYVLGEVDPGWESDRIQYARAFRREWGPGRRKAHRRAIAQRLQIREQLDRYLSRYAEILGDCPNPAEALAAVETALGLPKADPARLWKRLNAQGRWDDPRLQEAVQQIAGNPAPWLLLLRDVRLHHTLTRLALEDYEHYLQTIITPPKE